MLRLGTSLKCTESPYHRMVILSDPATNGGMVLLVRITTADRKWPDTDCILGPTEWSELTQRSTVAYSTAMCSPATQKLEAAIAAGLFEIIPSPPAITLQKIIQAALKAAGMSIGFKRWLAEVKNEDE